MPTEVSTAAPSLPNESRPLPGHRPLPSPHPTLTSPQAGAGRRAARSERELSQRQAGGTGMRLFTEHMLKSTRVVTPLTCVSLMRQTHTCRAGCCGKKPSPGPSAEGDQASRAQLGGARTPWAEHRWPFPRRFFHAHAVGPGLPGLRLRRRGLGQPRADNSVSSEVGGPHVCRAHRAGGLRLCSRLGCLAVPPERERAWSRERSSLKRPSSRAAPSARPPAGPVVRWAV